MPEKKVSFEELLGIKKMQKIAVERLHPPPESMVSEKEVDTIIRKSIEGKERNGETDSNLAIDFSYLANNSSFQRAIIEFIKKFIPGFENVKPRASKEVMVKSFNQNYANYKECMKELKEVIQNRNKE